VSLGEFGLILIIPLFLQTARHYSAFATGGFLAALALGALITGPAAAARSHRFGRAQIVSVGMLLEAAGITGVGLAFSTTASGWRLVPPLLVYGAGLGLATAQLTSVILIDVDGDRAGEASGIQSTARQVGSALGVAILSTTLAVSFVTRLDLRATPLTPNERATVIAVAKDENGPALDILRRQPRLAAAIPEVEHAYIDAARTAAFLAACFVVLGFCASLRLPRQARAARLGHETA
jgi:hypothetical protein